MNENKHTGSEAPAQRSTGAKRGESAQREQPNPFETGASRRTLDESRESDTTEDGAASRRTLGEQSGKCRQPTRGASRQSSSETDQQTEGGGRLQLRTDHTTERTSQVYQCLDCEATFQTYQHECPDCGAVAFKTATLESESSTIIREEVTGGVAKMTARLNPFVPR